MRQKRICAPISRNKTITLRLGQSQICCTAGAPSDKHQQSVGVNQMIKFVQIIFPAQNRHNIAMNS